MDRVAKGMSKAGNGSPMNDLGRSTSRREGLLEKVRDWMRHATDLFGRRLAGQRGFSHYSGRR